MNQQSSDLDLLRFARKAMEMARSPYSNIRVGAIAVGADGQIYPGCNVENASLGLTVCAERIALFNAVAHGTQDIRTLVITSDHPQVDSPCGACRQVILELAPNARILFGNADGIQKTWGSPATSSPTPSTGGGIRRPRPDTGLRTPLRVAQLFTIRPLGTLIRYVSFSVWMAPGCRP